MRGDATLVRLPEAVADGICSTAALPLRAAGSPVGVVVLVSRTPREPEPGLVRLLEGIGGHVTQFLQRREAESRAAEQAADLKMLSKVAHELAGQTDLYAARLSAARAVRGDHRGLVGRAVGADGAGTELEVTAASGAALRGMTVSLGERSVLSTVFRRGQLAFLADVPGSSAIAVRWHELDGRPIRRLGAGDPGRPHRRRAARELERPARQALRARRGAAAAARLRGRDHDPPHRPRRQAAVHGAHRPPDRAPQPARLGRGPRARARPRPAPRRQPVPGDARPRPLQGLQRPSRPPGRRPAAGRDGHRLAPGAAGHGHDRPLRRRGVRRAAPALGPGGARLVVERLLECVPLGQTASAGIAAWDGTETAQELLARADAALYDAKRSGRARALFSPSAL